MNQSHADVDGDGLLVCDDGDDGACHGGACYHHRVKQY